ncbi:DUF2235 domain-containing protein [Flocculibacter collagenilyticus]|uniref:DUF2235 domain-containing protein n=1 Tax=Flocculibacter collagenilyticus TaxID=2744479 RepID=UPI0018F74A46|nr:DUF2235 domain-containing protein [Flocculibacter collagenilyticus]
MKVQQKRIIVCCDGTWNEPDSNPTNVIKLVRSIKAVDEEGRHQVVFYDQGIGTHNYTDKVAGGVFGLGLAKNMLDGYRFIVHNYQQGDDIFLFGFSRGAYTVRALAGMIDTVGLLKKSQLTELRQAYEYYRTPPHQRAYNRYVNNLKPDITLLGVWDTVGALGAPTPLLKTLSNRWVGFFNTQLSSIVRNAYHALALDEKRHAFKPALWTGQISPSQIVEQTWFAGVHSDIGGGYEEHGLSDITLMWMIEKAQKIGLSVDEDYINNTEFCAPSAVGQLHDSHSLTHQWLERFQNKNGVRNIEGDINNPAINVTVHQSVKLRMKSLDDYRPENLERKVPESQAHERRNFERKVIDNLTGDLQRNKKHTDCNILDFSVLGGARIECDTKLKKNDKVTLASPEFARTVATCVWAKGGQYGVQFAA